MLVGWATDLCTRLKSHITHGEDLEAAGLALLRYQKVLKENGRIMSWKHDVNWLTFACATSAW